MLCFLPAKEARPACLLPAHDPFGCKVVELDLTDTIYAERLDQERQRFNILSQELASKLASAHPVDHDAIRKQQLRANYDHHVNCATLMQAKRDATPIGLQVYAEADPHSEYGLFVRNTSGALNKIWGPSTVLEGDRLVKIGLKLVSDGTYSRPLVDTTNMPYSKVVELFKEVQEEWRIDGGGSSLLCLHFDNPLGKWLRSKNRGTFNMLSDSFFNVILTQRKFLRFSKSKLNGGQRPCELIVHLHQKTLQWDSLSAPLAGMSVTKSSEFEFTISVFLNKKTKHLRLSSPNQSQCAHWFAGLTHISQIMELKSPFRSDPPSANTPPQFVLDAPSLSRLVSSPELHPQQSPPISRMSRAPSPSIQQLALEQSLSPLPRQAIGKEKTSSARQLSLEHKTPRFESYSDEEVVRIVASSEPIKLVQSSSLAEHQEITPQERNELIEPGLAAVFRRYGLQLSAELAADIMRWRTEPLQTKGESPPSYYDL